MAKKIIGQTLLEIADAIESGEFGKKIRVGLTTLGSEHGIDNLVNGANLAKSSLFYIVLIGKKVDTNFEVVEVSCEKEMHKKWKSY